MVCVRLTDTALRHANDIKSGFVTTTVTTTFPTCLGLKKTGLQRSWSGFGWGFGLGLWPGMGCRESLVQSEQVRGGKDAQRMSCLLAGVKCVLSTRDTKMDVRAQRSYICDELEQVSESLVLQVQAIHVPSGCHRGRITRQSRREFGVRLCGRRSVGGSSELKSCKPAHGDTAG
ncbi:hypothetical protein DPEC_G00137500 [Dallia pectoralis]|uniref:Uncharacterized protein n=1 Tax=Dallia pectoralis TaxID=75939 RepID=A0ACC2GLN4_DALPE|nr:hypothetical protein DPEC_G00137500 [Dallia pectoralis]